MTSVSRDLPISSEIMRLLGTRLALGRERYGHGVIVDQDPSQYGVGGNNWELMALEELLDGLVYTTAAIIRIKRHFSVKKTEENAVDDNEEILGMIAEMLTGMEPAEPTEPTESKGSGEIDKMTVLTQLLKKLGETTAEVVKAMRV